MRPPPLRARSLAMRYMPPGAAERGRRASAAEITRVDVLAACATPRSVRAGRKRAAYEDRMSKPCDEVGEPCSAGTDADTPMELSPPALPTRDKVRAEAIGAPPLKERTVP